MFTRQKFTPLGYEAIATLSSEKTLTVPSGAVHALIRAEDQDVRWTDDGTTATTTVGQVLRLEDPAMWYSGNLGALKFFEDDASALLKVSYYK